MSQWSEILADPIDRLLRRRCDDEFLRHADAAAWSEALWTEVEHVGVTLALVAEGQGGAGVSFPETAPIMRAVGYHATPLPIIETLLARGVLSQLGMEIAPGPLTVAMASGGTPQHAEVTGSRLKLRGHALAVPWARHLEAVVVIAFAEGYGQTAVTVPLAQTQIRKGVNAANEPRDEVTFEGVEVDASTVSWTGQDLAAQCWRRYALARCQQMSGAMQWVMDRTLAYVLERRQFGRAIGGFQAVQQLLARMCAHVSAAALASDSGMDAGTSSDDEVACAKSMVGDSAGTVAAIAHQLHGAMGYSWEYPLHHRTRRLWAWRDEFGNERYWQMALGRRAAARGASTLWENLTLP